MIDIDGKKYEINRKTAIVTNWDKIYCNILKRILKKANCAKTEQELILYLLKEYILN